MDKATQPEPIVGNKAIEDVAIRFVIEQERRFGREAKDTRYRGAPADVESGGRVIEVKAVGVEADGESLGTTPVRCEVIRGALRLKV